MRTSIDRPRSSFRIIHLLALVGLAAAPSAIADVKFTTVCAGGMQAPDGVFAGVVSGPRITNSGRITFGAAYVDSPHTGFFSWLDGQTDQLVRAGQEAPGLPPTIPPHPYFAELGAYYGGDDGSFIFTSRLAGTDINNTNDGGAWAAAPDGEFDLVVWEGDQAPGMPEGTVFVRWQDFQVTMGPSVGIVWAYTEHPDEEGERVGIWAWKDGQTQKVAAVGDPAPGTGTVFTMVQSATVDDAGTVRFLGSTELMAPANGIWRSGDDGLQLVAFQGDPIPDGTAFFDRFMLHPAISHNGATAGVIWLAGPGVGYPNDKGIYRFGDGASVQIVRGGDPIPDGPPGETMLIPEVLAVNDAGQTVFDGSVLLDGQVYTSLWVGDGQSFATIAREDDPAPGFAEGWNFGEFSQAAAVIDSSGRVCFSMRLHKPGENDRWGVWAWTADDGLQLVVKSGDSIEVAPGNVQTVLLAELWAHDLVRGTAGGGQDGQLALRIEFKETPGKLAAILAELDTIVICAPDCDGNTVLDLFDFLCFVNAFNAQDPGADCTQDGVYDLFDFLCFVNQFNAGC